MSNCLTTLVREELAQPVQPQVTDMATAIASCHPGALAVIFYGSCLRDATLSGMLDFYLIVQDYGLAYGGGWQAVANRLLPPNVFPFAKDDLAAKYAVLSLEHLRRETATSARDPSTYARLAQPCRLVWVASDVPRQHIETAIATASETLLTFAAPLVPDGERADPLAIWRTAFAGTYRTELRAERSGRSDSIVDADTDRYVRFSAAVMSDGKIGNGPWTGAHIAAARVGQKYSERVGKRRQIAKLAKAAFTFAGGIDYLAWKINRHAGTQIAITPWQRRHPLLAAVTLVPRLLRQGAVK